MTFPVRSIVTAALAALVLRSPPAGSAQSGDADLLADSARLHAAARKAQATFERVRQHRLPWVFRSGGGRCDEYVGRYCVRHDRGDDDWRPPREHRAISEARDVLLTELGAAVRTLPGDEWVAGQRVAYLIDAGRLDDAQDAVRACAAPRWWCAALAGLVRHERGETRLAEGAFDEALASMPADELERWRDLRPVLGARDGRKLREKDALARDSLASRLWWLADPLWMRPGNDRLVEQHARLVRVRIAADARNPEGVRWGPDLEELLLRLGWPAGWERFSSGGLERRVTIVTHRAPFGREFVPPLEHAAAPFEMPPNAWPLVPFIPVTEYAPPYARFEGSVPHQLVVIPDGDSVVIAAAIAFSHDSVAADAPSEVALVAAAPDFRVMDSAWAVASRAVRAVRLSRRDVVASVEAVVRTDVTRAARTRFGLPLTRRDSTAVAISDPLLIDAGPPPPSRAAAIDRLLVPGDVTARDSVGVYFEAERLAPDVPVEVEIVLEAERGGALRRLGESVGLIAPRGAVRLAWTEPPPAGGRLTRAVTLGFRDVPNGAYTLRLMVRQDAALGASVARIER
ncbi:MAG TPA: hypothetical protein VK922_16855 [Gemmatimonadaceae bacterium]|nr:hypothetical protein [Gemmatimonadaceae bacterium]